jgi:hypothetical protein
MRNALFKFLDNHPTLARIYEFVYNNFAAIGLGIIALAIVTLMVAVIMSEPAHGFVECRDGAGEIIYSGRFKKLLHPGENIVILPEDGTSKVTTTRATCLWRYD